MTTKTFSVKTLKKKKKTKYKNNTFMLIFSYNTI